MSQSTSSNDEDLMVIKQKWQQLAIQILHDVHNLVNAGEFHTGIVLMFFSAENHGGKSTIVSSATDRAELKKLLKTALREIDGPRTTLVEQGRMQ